jgi:hypothetical protein
MGVRVRECVSVAAIRKTNVGVPHVHVDRLASLPSDPGRHDTGNDLYPDETVDIREVLAYEATHRG